MNENTGVFPDRIGGTHWKCEDCGKMVERGLLNWVEHTKNECSQERKQAFADAGAFLAAYGEYLKSMREILSSREARGVKRQLLSDLIVFGEAEITPEMEKKLKGQHESDTILPGV